MGPGPVGNRVSSLRGQEGSKIHETLTPDLAWLQRQSELTLKRLMPRLESRFRERVDEGEWAAYCGRLQQHFPRLFVRLHHLYGHQYDFFYHLESILGTTTEMWMERPDDLKALDALRVRNPLWYQSNRMVGAVCYVSLFAGTLNGIREKIPYLKELGITYLHLMPLFRTPEGDNDGGYAVSSFRETAPDVGTMEDLARLAAELRQHGISLCLDFIFNHTSDEHEWALKARAGDPEYQAFFHVYPDRVVPDQVERTTRAIFPDEHPGRFTYRPRMRKWVWTTFHSYQWDLNYSNPAVFEAMTAEMLFLANQGVEVLRLDAVAFLWKQLGTSCENLPEAHIVIQACNAIVSIAAPAMVFKSEAIVHPDEVARYINTEECQLSYNPLLMALLWEALATRSVRLLRHSMQKRFAIPAQCSWVNYIRCHDDIGWTFSDEDAAELGMNGHDHRSFLTRFYTGRFQGSFAAGVPFQEDPATGDARVSGTAASLCGLERATEEGNPLYLEHAIRRILMLHGVIMTVGGIPLIYLGDELGQLNDYGYRESPEKDGDSRWVHRPPFHWTDAERRADPDSVCGRLFQGILRLIRIRQDTPAFARGDTEFVDPGNDHVLAWFRQNEDWSVMCLANFSDHPQTLQANRLRHVGLKKTVTDILSGRTIIATSVLEMEPYQFMVLLGVR